MNKVAAELGGDGKSTEPANVKVVWWQEALTCLLQVCEHSRSDICTNWLVQLISMLADRPPNFGQHWPSIREQKN